VSTTGEELQDARLDRRVVVVEDNEWRRRGLVDGLRQLGGALTAYAAMPLEEALGFNHWDQVDIVLVDAAWRRDHWDRFFGLRVGDAIRACLPEPAPVTVLLVGHEANHLLVVRAAEAGFDFVYQRAGVRTIDDLERMVLAPDLGRSPGRIADFPALRQLGLSFSSRLNAGVAFVEENGLAGQLADGPTALSRRRSITVRQRIADLVGIRPTGPASAATVERTLPSWRQVQQIFDLARGAT